MIYSHAQAKALHHAPLAIVLLLPLLSSGPAGISWGGLVGSTLLAVTSVLSALALPVAVGFVRAFASGELPTLGSAMRAFRCACFGAPRVRCERIPV